MPVIPSGQIVKSVAFGAPYAAATFNDQQNLIHSRQGVLSGFQIEESGGNLIVQPGKALVNGIVVEVTAEQTISLPAFTEPYILYITTPDEIPSTNVTLDFTDFAGFSFLFLPIAERTTDGKWRSFPYISEDFIVANTRGGVTIRQTDTLAGAQTNVPFSFPFSPPDQFHDTLLVFEDGKFQQKSNFWSPNGVKGITLTSPAAGAEILHLLGTDDIEWIEEQTLGAPQTTIDTVHPFTVGGNDLLVFQDDAGKLRLAQHYTETDSDTIELTGALGAVDITLVKLKHTYWREEITLAGAVTTQALANVYEPARAETLVFQSAAVAALGLLTNPGTSRDYTELNGQEIEFSSTPEIYTGGALNEVLEIYRVRSGFPKGMGQIIVDETTVNTGEPLLYSAQVAVGGTPEVFTVATYDNSGNAMNVYRNGKKLAKGHSEFTTPSSTTVSVGVTLAGDQMEFIVN